MAIALEDTVVTDFRRDRWGRPLIVPTDNGKAIPYTRFSSAAKTVEEHWNLEMWARRNVAYGMSHDASLVARVLAVGGNPGSWDMAAKNVVNKVHEDAQQVAQAHKAADIGSAVHLLTERMDRGETVVGGPYQADLDAYQAALDAAGLTCRPEWVECRMVCDDLQMAGTTDRILTGRSDHLISDLKTGPSVTYGGLGWSAQLAGAAHGHLYDVTTDQRLPTPRIDKTTGIIIHLPAGQGTCTLYEIDLVAGYRAAQLANEIRAVRKESKRWITVLDVTSSSVAESAGESPGQPARALNLQLPTQGSGTLAATDEPPSDTTPVSDHPPVPVAGGVAPPAPIRSVGAGVEHDRRDQLLDRYQKLSANDQRRFLTLDFDEANLDEVEGALNAVDPYATVIPPAPPAPPAVPRYWPAALPTLYDIDEGALILRKSFDPLRTAHAVLADERRRWVGDIISQSRRAAVSIAPWPNADSTVRGFELLAGLIALAGGDGTDDDELVVELAATAHGSDMPFAASTAGQAVGILNATQAATFADLCRNVVDDVTSVDVRQRPTVT